MDDKAELRTKDGALLDGYETATLLAYAGDLRTHAREFRAGTVEQFGKLADHYEHLAGRIEKLAVEGGDRLRLAVAKAPTLPRA